MKDGKIILGITQGDINGISYEVIIKSLADNRITDFCTPVIYGSPKIFGFYKNQLKLETINFNLITKASELQNRRVNFINVMGENAHAECGQATALSGEGSILALKQAIADVKNKYIDVIVTGPINKNNIEIPNTKFSGHTEFLAKAFGVENYIMLMVSDNFKVGVVTGHIPLSAVPSTINKDLILKKITTMEESLKKDFMIVKPRIAVLGLNPHCGDKGLIGNEESEIIAPAIAQAQENGILAFGPFSADGFLASENVNKFDAVLAMYHDQGMIAFKSRAFDTGVNYTAGLPFVRTSPAHGTAYEIAGKGIANPNSFRAAIYLAYDIFRNRQRYAQMMENPMKVEYSQNIPKQYDSRTDKTIVITDD